jgi:hypothetical protein
MPSHFFVPDPEIFSQLEGLKLEADDELIEETSPVGMAQ